MSHAQWSVSAHIHNPGFHTGFFAGGGKLFRKSKCPCRGGIGIFWPGFISIGHVMLGVSGGMPPRKIFEI